MLRRDVDGRTIAGCNIIITDLWAIPAFNGGDVMGKGAEPVNINQDVVSKQYVLACLSLQLKDVKFPSVVN